MEWLFDTRGGEGWMNSNEMTSATRRPRISIVPYEAKYRDAFRTLNEEWLNFYHEMEAEDMRVLSDPEGVILAKGGMIILALDGETPIGTGALINEGGRKFELAKLAVTEAYRGQGIGKLLSQRLIAIAEASGADEVELVSSSVLPIAKHLYKKLGFRDIPLGEMLYARADIRMAKSLRPAMSTEG
jgi:ribosomal protein S18 acetylase RimI-like enzyme